MEDLLIQVNKLTIESVNAQDIHRCSLVLPPNQMTLFNNNTYIKFESNHCIMVTSEQISQLIPKFPNLKALVYYVPHYNIIGGGDIDHYNNTENPFKILMIFHNNFSNLLV